MRDLSQVEREKRTIIGLRGRFSLAIRLAINVHYSQGLTNHFGASYVAVLVFQMRRTSHLTGVCHVKNGRTQNILSEERKNAIIFLD